MGTTTVESSRISEADATIGDAIGALENFVSAMAGREIVSTNEVIDVFLDVRQILVGNFAVEATAQSL
jgi:hypothetical protein